MGNDDAEIGSVAGDANPEERGFSGSIGGGNRQGIRHAHRINGAIRGKDCRGVDAVDPNVQVRAELDRVGQTGG